MLTAKEIVDIYISFFEKRGHKRIPNSPLIPQNDPTTLFTSSGMQPLVPYLLGEPHPQGKRLVNVQNCFRAQDIDEVGDNRHTTFFRMLGNWSLGDYFKREQLPWFFEFLVNELKLPADRLYVSVFKGFDDIPKDEEAANIWKQLFENANVDPSGRIFYYGVDENWWSRSGEPKDMPAGEPGGPDSEVFFDFYPEQGPIGKDLKIYSHNGRLLEIGNSVFMQYQKQADGSFKELPQKNVDFGGGLERLLAAVENQQDMFQTNLFSPIIQIIEKQTEKDYKSYAQEMRIVTDHLIAATFVSANGVSPSNKEQGYILRRLIRRGLDGFYKLNGKDILPVLESIVEQYKDTDPNLVSLFEKIKYTLLQEEKTYKQTLTQAKKYIIKQSNLEINISEKVKVNEGLKAITKISPDDAFILYTTHGLSPTQIKSLGYEFDEQEFAKKMEEHQALSRKGAEQKFKGGLADTQEKTIMGHTATHLLHQALRDVLGNKVHQTGSNITTERVRFDFNYDQKLTDEQIKEVEKIVNEKIRENLPVHFEMLPLEEAKKIGAIGLFDEKYGDKVKVYFIGGGPSARASTDLSRMSSRRPYSAEFCGGPHVDFTQRLKRFKIIKQENIGHGQRRIYAKVND